ncbi:MAG: GNAT family N-acetyltransferase [Clostridiales bacterium]|nr:GNAT family N-acetyltransferase [Clostridiales bacterium]
MNYRIIEGAGQIPVSEAERLLKTTYWAGNRSGGTIEKSMRNSACYGIWSDEEQKLIGFARVITDYATTWYLCDVIIDEAYRHQGLGKELVSHIASEFAGLRGLLLTRDAHGLYGKYGFETVEGRAMSRPPQR